MSTTFIETVVQGSTQSDFSVPFTYITESDVKVYVDGVITTDYTYTNGSLITFTTPPTEGSTVLIRRETDATAKAVDFQSGAMLTESDLDTAFDQAFNLAQESIDRAEVSGTTYENRRRSEIAADEAEADALVAQAQTLIATSAASTSAALKDEVNVLTTAFNGYAATALSNNVTAAQRLLYANYIYNLALSKKAEIEATVNASEAERQVLILTQNDVSDLQDAADAQLAALQTVLDAVDLVDEDAATATEQANIALAAKATAEIAAQESSANLAILLAAGSTPLALEEFS